MYQLKVVVDSTDAAVVGTRSLPRRGIVLHETIGEDSLSWLQGGSAQAGRPASADFLISKSGDIYQITRLHEYAFHSGRARWRFYQEKDTSINQGFFGIELENNPGVGEYVNSQQYIACAALVRYLLTWHNIDFRNVCGHYECALPDGRKSDPVTLNWAMLTEEMLSPSPEAASYNFGMLAK